MSFLSTHKFRKKITINSSLIDSNLTDFPIRISLDDTNFLFGNARADGFDVIFTSDDGLTLLNYEREIYNNVTEKAEFWVNIPSVSSSTDTEIYIYYGDSDAIDTEIPENVWSSDYKGVYHLHDDFLDSTSNNNDLTDNSSANSIGKIADARSFGNNMWLDASDDNSLDITTGIHLKAWINAPSYNQSVIRVVEKAGTSDSIWLMGISSNTLYFGLWNGGAQTFFFSGTLTDGQAHMVTCEWNGSNMIGYIDGVQVNSISFSGPIDTSNENFNIGRRQNPTPIYWGTNDYIDEVRVGDTAKGADWIKAEFNSETNNLLVFLEEEYKEDIIISDESHLEIHNSSIDNIELSDNILVNLATSQLESDQIEISDLADVFSTVNSNEQINIFDSIELNVPLENIISEETINISDSVLANISQSVNFASRIVHTNPLIFVTDTDPVKIIEVDISDPDNPTWIVHTINSSGIDVKNAKDICINEAHEQIYIACAEGQILRLDLNNLGIGEEQIDTGDLNDLENISCIEEFNRTYAGTDDTDGEILFIEDTEVGELNTDIRLLVEVGELLSTSIDINNAEILNTDIRLLETIETRLGTDLRFLAVPFDETAFNAIGRPDVEVRIDGILVEDVKQDAIVIRHQVGEFSEATFILGRRHDQLNLTVDGLSRPITNQNNVQITIAGHIEFTGKISQINTNSESENVTISASSLSEKTKTKRNITVPMSQLNEKLHPFHVLLNNPSILDPFIDPNEENPKIFKGIKVNLGTRRAQRVLRFRKISDNPVGQTFQDFGSSSLGLFSSFGAGIGRLTIGTFTLPTFTPDTGSIGGFSVGRTAAAIMEGDFKPKQNWTYFWGPVIAENFLTGSTFNGFYVGTSMSGFSSDLWELIQVRYRYQRILDDIISEQGEFTVGSAPFKDISTRNGTLITKTKWQDRNNGLYEVKEASFDFIDFAKKVAELEFDKLKTINGSILPRTSGNIELMLDAYYYYGIQMLTRMNIDRTTETNIYKNNNGFPLAVKSITITTSNMRVSMSVDNLLSICELEDIDNKFPNEEDFQTAEKSTLIEVKFDPSRFEKVE